MSHAQASGAADDPEHDGLLAPAPAHARVITVYTLVIFLVPAALWVWLTALEVPRTPWASWEMLSRYLFAVLLLFGELRPMLLARSDGETDGITISTTFAMALVLVGPLSLAMLVQGLAVVADDVWKRRQPRKVLFNVGQYLFTLASARAVFCLLSGHAFASGVTRLEPSDLLASLVAGLTFFIVNNGAVAIVVALDHGQNAVENLRTDIKEQILTSGILIGLAPVAIVAVEFSLWTLPLLVLPLVGVRHHAFSAALRQHEALHDGLTGLPNRALFRLRADRAIAAASGGGTAPMVAVMLLDLDHFKEVNDTLGHHVGDKLLRMVAARVSAAVPATATLARLGGDEFAILITSVTDPAAVSRLADRIAARLREPVVAEGVRLAVQASIGIALSGDHDATTDTMLQRADIALYRAKTNRGEAQVYRPEIDQHNVQRLSLLGDLHSASDNDEFEMVYQPQVDAATGRVVAAEALMRWNHPRHGVVSPDVFIPLAENTGLIRAMSRTAIEVALATIGRLRAGGHDLSIAVNVSARLLSDLQMPTWIAMLLMDSGVPSGQLTVEVTESSIMADPTRATQVLADIRDLGVRLSIDDFGTGYSSLSYIRRLQPDELKIDRSFVTQMLSDENSRVIVRSTIDLGHSLGLTLVAEGVEDEATFQTLAEFGCDRIQGYHVARPMAAGTLEPWLERAARDGWRTSAGTADASSSRSAEARRDGRPDSWSGVQVAPASVERKRATWS